MKKYFLSIQSVFKNESHILEEWLNHYIKEGVEHFYLFNNNSNDNFMNIINKYDKYIDLFDAKENYKQLEHLKSKFDKIKKETEWIMNVDLDELLFAKEDYKTIPDIINLLNSNITNLGGIRCSYMIFNSNNHIKQPKSVIKSFTDRLDFNKSFKNIKQEKIKTGHPNKPNGKWIAKTKLLIDFSIHTFKSNGNINYGGIKNLIKNNNKIIESNEELGSHLLQLNHYVLQSKELFMKVKCIRGDVAFARAENVRNINYFNKYNNLFTGYKDVLLKNKKY